MRGVGGGLARYRPGIEQFPGENFGFRGRIEKCNGFERRQPGACRIRVSRVRPPGVFAIRHETVEVGQPLAPPGGAFGPSPSTAAIRLANRSRRSSGFSQTM